MRSPDVATAVTALEKEGLLSREQATLFGRVARGELVSLSFILHVLLYGGVLAITGGVGLLVKDHVADLGPLSIALLIGAAALACLVWVQRVAAPFSMGAVPSPHIAFDYLLLLGALLLAAELAYCEWQFTPLGGNWAWHLLLVSLIYGVLALRFDSRGLFLLALTTFVAWRGFATVNVEQALFAWAGTSLAVRLNGLACGLLFLSLGQGMRRNAFKAHFEPIATFLGWMSVLLAVAGGISTGAEGALWLHRIALLILGVALARLSFAVDRFELFVMGVLAAYVGFLAITLRWFSGGAVSTLYVAVSAVALLALLLAAHRRRPGVSS